MPVFRDIRITKYDYERLMKLLDVKKERKINADRRNLKRLRNELIKAKKVDSREIPPEYVTMNSTFMLKNLGYPEKETYTIVFPQEESPENKKISILSKAGFAVLGYKVGDVVKWETPGGEKYLQIEKIIYQPEAAGDYHL